MIKNWFFLGIVAALTTFSQVEGSCSGWDEVVKEVLANEIYCVKGEKEDKIYLHSENIKLTEDGLCLDLNGLDVLPLSCLFSDGGGCYIPRSGNHFTEPPMPIYCPKCKFWHSWPPCSIEGD